jgi:hypothetical protein
MPLVVQTPRQQRVKLPLQRVEKEQVVLLVKNSFVLNSMRYKKFLLRDGYC